MRTFARLLSFLAPYRRGVIVSALLASAAMAMTVLLPYLTGVGVNAITAGVRAHAAHSAARQAHERHVLLLVAVAILLAVLARWGLTLGRRLVAGRVSLGVEYDLRRLLYAHLQRLELAFFDGQQTGQLMSRVTVDLQAVRFFLGYGLVFILQSALTIVLAAVAMIAIDPLLGVIAIAPTPFVVLIAERYGKRARPAVQEVQQRIAELTAEAEESITGVRIVKAFAREDERERSFRERVGRVFEQAMVATRLEARYNPMIAFLPQLGLTAVLLAGGDAVIHSQLSIGSFSALYFYLNMLVSPMRTLGVTLGLAQRATASGARIFELLEREPQLRESPRPRPLPAGRGALELQAVSLRYSPAPALGARARAGAAAGAQGDGEPDDGARAALQEVSLEIPAGSTVALIGPTGAGKSSLAALLGRLYDPSAGAVLLDGADLRSLRLAELRRSVAYVGAEPFLFSSTIAQNIAYGRPDASTREIESAARTACAHEFIAALPEGYRTRVGERGLTLSGGQRQRMAIARALLVSPRVLVLDDATSALDASTEHSIVAQLRAMAGQRTTVVIAHRAPTVAVAELVAVLEDGRLVAFGDHAQVRSVSPFYRELFAQPHAARAPGRRRAGARRRQPA